METNITTKFNIRKPANDVFEAIVDPNKIANYWFSSGTARLEQGKKITWRYDEYNAQVEINVLEVIDYKKIVYSWGEYDEETVVTITLNELDNRGTLIEVTESGFKENDPDIVNKMIGQKEGWVYALTCLKAYLENGVNNLRASLVH
ncbi:SRPBCC family protein [Bacillus sp. FJAT-22090]|uniref:SRPBCC family protein n=1 Tax=Bacillus sp. FJAT-22090 TaxID=1581038 RepID=UPI0011AA19ED|nr:SRPBCC family protein [Bacillus sp. FJAT-22090]